MTAFQIVSRSGQLITCCVLLCDDLCRPFRIVVEPADQGLFAGSNVGHQHTQPKLRISQGGKCQHAISIDTIDTIDTGTCSPYLSDLLPAVHMLARDSSIRIDYCQPSIRAQISVMQPTSHLENIWSCQTTAIKRRLHQAKFQRRKRCGDCQKMQCNTNARL